MSKMDINKNEGEFVELLQAAEQLTAEMDQNGDLPRVERNLKQILDAGRQLWSRTSQSGFQDVKASILLGSKGFDLPSISQKLESLNTAKSFDSIKPVKDWDVQGFLKNERENAILSVIEETKAITYNYTGKNFWECMNKCWQQEKLKILTSLGSLEKDNIELRTVPIVNTNLLMTSSSTVLSKLELAYMKEIYEYHQQIIHGGIQVNLVQKFSEAAKNCNDQSIADLWEMVQFMSNISHFETNNVAAFRQSPSGILLFLHQAKNYLEHCFLRHMQCTVAGKLQQSQLGGIPGNIPLARAYLQLKLIPSSHFQDGTVHGQPVWALIYCCFRCGDLKSVLEIAKAAGSVLSEFCALIQELINSPDERLCAASKATVQLQYRCSLHSCTVRLIYCILGSCDISNDHSEVATRTEDYLWLKLYQLHVSNPDDMVSKDKLTYEGFQSLLLEEYGETHFEAYQHPLIYASVLFLTSQFEAAIEFLSRFNLLRPHAVHIALALHEQHLLAITDTPQQPMLAKDSLDKPPFRHINLARLLLLYTKQFETAEPGRALQYFWFLREIYNENDQSLFETSIVELVLISKEFELLLGKLDHDGCYIPGCIEQFDVNIKKIIEMVADNSEKEGLLEDAAKLYDLMKNHEKVFELLLKVLSQVATQTPAQDSVRDRLYDYACKVGERYKKYGHHGSAKLAAIFYLLLDIMAFFDLYHAKKFDKALDIVIKLKCIPFHYHELENYIDEFKNFTEDIRCIIPYLLLAVMNILYSKYRAVKNNISPIGLAAGRHIKDGGQAKCLEELRSQASCLITYAGMIPYRLPGDTSAQLMQTEVLMH